jgi:nucleotide-binding universal stress UspA family protein
VEPPSLPQWGYAHLAIREAKLRGAARTHLDQLSSQLTLPENVIASKEVRDGAPAMEIGAAAEERKIDLVVIASRGLGTFPRSMIGSTAERVVRHAQCPVLAVHHPGDEPPPAFAPGCIVVTTDFSARSQKAFAYAAAMAREFGSKLLVLHVVPEHLPPEFSQLGLLFQEETLFREALRKLPEFCAAAFPHDSRFETVVARGAVAHTILKTAEEEQADLIVMATHGHTGLKHFFLGSVTENVVRHARCPVLAVREREHDFLH